MHDSTDAYNMRGKDLSEAVSAIQGTLADLGWIDNIEEGVSEYLAALDNLPEPDRSDCMPQNLLWPCGAFTTKYVRNLQARLNLHVHSEP